MNEFVKVLYDEHDIIISAIEIAKKTDELIEKDPVKFEYILGQLIHFFRQYADRFHHFKEEEILFPEMKQKNEMIGLGIIHEMLDNHYEFRGLIKQIEHQVVLKKHKEAYALLYEYSEKLLDHIAVENDELFLMTEQLFDDAELERIQFRFEDCDRDLGYESKEELKNSLQLLIALF